MNYNRGMMNKSKHITFSIIILLSTFFVASQQPSGIVVNSDYNELSNIDLVWNILIFGIIPIVLITIYFFFRNKR